MGYDELFYFDEKKLVPASNDKGIRLIEKAGFDRDQGTYCTLRVYGKRRGLSMTMEYFPCQHGWPMKTADGTHNYCMAWRNVKLSGVYGALKEQEKAEFIPIAIAFLKQYRKWNLPVARIEFAKNENINPSIIEIGKDEYWHIADL